MAALYILAGVNHFRAPSFYVKIMPTWIPNHKLMVMLSGIAEIVLGAFLLVPQTQSLAAWGIILMLIVFFSVHIFMIQNRNTLFKDKPAWILYLRLPMQFVLIYWAYLYT